MLLSLVTITIDNPTRASIAWKKKKKNVVNNATTTRDVSWHVLVHRTIPRRRDMPTSNKRGLERIVPVGLQRFERHQSSWVVADNAPRFQSSKRMLASWCAAVAATECALPFDAPREQEMLSTLGTTNVIEDMMMKMK